MLRTLLLAGAAASALAAFPAAAATVCAGLGGLVVTCSAADSAPIEDARDGLSVTIEPGAAIESDDRGTPPLNLGGANQFVLNEGRLENTDPRNNTNAIQSVGTGLTVENEGEIRSGDRAVHVVGGDGDFTLINREGGEIFARRQAVRTENDLALPNSYVENRGLIESTNGRAIQLRGPGSTVMNYGTLIGGEEVVETREDFTMENHGLVALRGLSWDPDTRTWTNAGAVDDEDGVQFASGALRNYGVILSTDDGVDLDEGYVFNAATGVIVSAGPDDVRNAGAVDVDEQFEPTTGPDFFRPSGALTVENEGYMEGPRAIVTADGSTAPVTILNTGTLVGRSGIAIDMAPTQGDTLISLSGGGQIFGDVLFGAGGANTLALGPFDDGAGIFSKVSAHEGGTFEVVFEAGFTLADILAYRLIADLFEMDLRAGSGRFRFNALGAAGFTLEGDRYDTAEFARFLGDNGVAPIPLPATLPLLLAGLGGLAVLRRRRAA